MMIVSIESPIDSCRPAIEYNERKVLAGGAFLVGYANLDSTDQERIYEVFDRYENSLYPMRRKSFHASINPSSTDTCTEEQVLEFAAALMDHLGYGKQPILVYRHSDIDREHYHVVSVRVDVEGRKIKNLYEKKSASAFIRKVACNYGFSIAERGEKSVVSADTLEEKKSTSGRIRHFSQRSDAPSQLKSIWAAALTYDFDGFAQLQAILEDLGVKATLKPLDDGYSVELQGVDKKGKTISSPYSEDSLGVPLYEEFKAIHNQEIHRRKSREKGRLRNIVGFAFDVSKSENHFCNILAEKGIRAHFYRREETGEISGISFVDHTTKTVFKASEIRDVISVKMALDAIRSGKWRLERSSNPTSSTKRSREEARKDAIALRNRQSGVIAHLLTPAHTSASSSWSGKSQQTPEQRRDERDSQKQGALNATLVDTRYIEKIH